VKTKAARTSAQTGLAAKEDFMKHDQTGIARRRALVMAVGGMGLLASSAPAYSGTRSAAPLSRGRFGLSADTPPLARVNLETIVRWDKTYFNDGNDFSLQPDGRVLIRKAGLYHFTMSIDWPGQHGVDHDLRMTSIRRQRPAGEDPTPGKGNRLASSDVPGSDPPQVARYEGMWLPGTLPPGTTITHDIKVGPIGIVGLGDIAMLSLSQIGDEVIGAFAAKSLVVQARVVGPDTVRVFLTNTAVRFGIDIPEGTIKVVAMSSSGTRGESADAYQMLHSPSEDIAQGEVIYGVVKSKAAGDYLQGTETTFLQIDRLA
jgi:hypothetical protein